VCLDTFDLCSSLSIDHNQVIAASEGNLLPIDRKRRGHGSKLNLVLFGEEIDLVHDGIIEYAADHLRLVQHYSF
jgi:hypothetical protein